MKRAIAAMWIGSVGCISEVPPPPLPAQVVPDVAPVPPEPGKGQVAIAADEPALVELVTGTFEGVGADGSSVAGNTYRVICARTPCAVNLERGEQPLRLTSLVDPEHDGTGSVTVGDEPTVYRYALGHNVEPKVGSTLGAGYLLTIGGMGLVGGAVMIGLGDATSSDGLGMTTHTDLRPWGVGAVVVSGAMIALAVHLLRHGGGRVQPGVGLQWTP